MVKDVENLNEIEESIKDFIKEFLIDHQNLENQDVIQFSNDNVYKKLDELEFSSESRPMYDVINDAVNYIFKYRAKLNHPRYYGFIPGPASLVSWVGDVVTSAYNMHAGSWMSTPAASYVESKILAWLNNKIGYSDQSGGIFVSGGSIANITALTLARDSKLDGNLTEGIAYISDQTHSSIIKGLKIIGINENNIRKIGTNDRYEINIINLHSQIKKDLKKGLTPFVLIASAGTTNTGSIDNLEGIYNVCKEFDLWMHVDGAYGATALLSQEHKSKFKGIENADSVSWDAHKWLFQTYDCGMILVKNKSMLFNSFNTKPEYLRDAQINNEEINFWDFGIELTRPARYMKLWFTFQVLGLNKIEERIDHGIRLAEFAENQVSNYKDWKIITNANLGILNFRYSPNNLNEKLINEINTSISKRIVNSSYAGVFTTVLNDQVVLRICSINPETTYTQIKDTIALLDEYARNIYEVLLPNDS